VQTADHAVHHASARQEKLRLMDLHPDMMAIAFNAHDEFFQPDPAYPANEMYASHPRDELETYSRAALEKGVKVEVESFHTGALWNMEFIANMGLLPEPLWTTLFLGWPGGSWTPPPPRACVHGRPTAGGPASSTGTQRDGPGHAVEDLAAGDHHGRACAWAGKTIPTWKTARSRPPTRCWLRRLCGLRASWGARWRRPTRRAIIGIPAR
jgi:hypothetical protein